VIARAFRFVLPPWAAFVLQPVLLLLLLVWSGWAVCSYGNYRIAYSPSVPLGIYQLEQRPVARGDYALFCPPPGPLFDAALHHFWIAPGECAAGTRHLMKLVVVVEGDHVLFREDGVLVNGGRVPNSGCRTKDAHGVLLPRPAVRELVLGPDQRVLMSHKGPDSFDSRYFGPITGQIVGRLKPIFTWEM
jgi:conjugative transfer signal peptidase TraF